MHLCHYDMIDSGSFLGVLDYSLYSDLLTATIEHLYCDRHAPTVHLAYTNSLATIVVLFTCRVF